MSNIKVMKLAAGGMTALSLLLAPGGALASGMHLTALPGMMFNRGFRDFDRDDRFHHRDFDRDDRFHNNFGHRDFDRDDFRHFHRW